MQTELTNTLKQLKKSLSNLELPEDVFKSFAINFYDYTVNHLSGSEKENPEIVQQRLFKQLQKSLNLAQYYANFNQLRLIIYNWYSHDCDNIETTFKLIAVQNALIELLESQILNYFIPTLLPEYLSLQAVN
ncbi:hypothetical protein L3V82_01775 [Thiotrichales bacterium 19S3-7]|nr:hypothetical protein [Thiotrichales bacterium 19S3-7]MCF6800893.1 hypothetical protein [Thiotrichales bacterium 19S3-11]